MLQRTILLVNRALKQENNLRQEKIDADYFVCGYSYREISYLEIFTKIF